LPILENAVGMLRFCVMVWKTNILLYTMKGVIYMIFFTRHGETDWNIAKRIQGKTDTELNENGLKQAEIVSYKMKDKNIDIIISSPLKRAKKTAEIINKNINCPIIYEDGLVERDYGEFEGKQREDFDFYGFWDYNKNLRGYGIENIRDFFDRVYSTLDKIKREYKGKNILIVSHGGVSRIVNCYFFDVPKQGDLTNMSLENCEVLILEK